MAQAQVTLTMTFDSHIQKVTSNNTVGGDTYEWATSGQTTPTATINSTFTCNVVLDDGYEIDSVVANPTSTTINNITSNSFGGDGFTSNTTITITSKKVSPSYKFQRFAKVSDSITNKMKNYLDIKKSCQSMFQGCSELTREQLNTILDENDTENVTTMDTMFGGCYNLSSIPLLNISNVTTMSSMFHSCYSLISVPAFDVSNVTNLDNIFTDCSNLETIHMTGMKVKFSISSSTKFTREALIEILNNLATVTSTTTLNMGSINLAKLTDEDKAIATNKGWTLLI